MPSVCRLSKWGRPCVSSLTIVEGFDSRWWCTKGCLSSIQILSSQNSSRSYIPLDDYKHDIPGVWKTLDGSGRLPVWPKTTDFFPVWWNFWVWFSSWKGVLSGFLETMDFPGPGVFGRRCTWFSLSGLWRGWSIVISGGWSRNDDFVFCLHPRLHIERSREPAGRQSSKYDRLWSNTWGKSLSFTITSDTESKRPTEKKEVPKACHSFGLLCILLKTLSISTAWKLIPAMASAAGPSMFQRFWAWRKANPYREYFMSTHFWVSFFLDWYWL